MVKSGAEIHVTMKIKPDSGFMPFQYDILKDHQHGFRKRRSCETQLTVTIQEIASRLSKGNQVDIILLDFAKAVARDTDPYP